MGSQREPHFQWNIGGVGSSGVGHVYFMYISCCLCIIFRVGYAKISRRKGRFQWNMGFIYLAQHLLIISFTYLCEQTVALSTDNDDSSSWVEPFVQMFDNLYPVRYEMDAASD